MVDLLLLLASSGAGWTPGPSAAAGVLGGAATSFTLNRRFAFRRAGPVLGPALRFALGTAALATVHAGAVTWLAVSFRAPLLVAKYASDVAVLLGGNLLLLRYVVFPSPRVRSAQGTAGVG